MKSLGDHKHLCNPLHLVEHRLLIKVVPMRQEEHRHAAGGHDKVLTCTVCFDWEQQTMY